MEFEALQSIGLTRNEAETYVALSKTGSISAGKLSKRVEVHRSRVYEALDSLVRQGLVSVLTINNVNHYTAEPPARLLDILEEKKELLEEAIPSLETIQQEPEIVQKISGFQGVGGIKNLLNETLNTQYYAAIGGPQTSIDILGGAFWKNYHRKANARQLRSRIIFNREIAYWSGGIKEINEDMQIRYLQKHFDTITQTFILDDRVIIITWSAQPLGMMLTDKTVADSYKKFFEVLWKQAEE